MKKYIVYNSSGKIIRTGQCTDKVLHLQAKDGEFMIEGTANDITHKVNPVTKRVNKKTASELPKPRAVRQPVPEGQKIVQITNDQWESVMSRIEKLET